MRAANDRAKSRERFTPDSNLIHRRGISTGSRAFLDLSLFFLVVYLRALARSLSPSGIWIKRDSAEPSRHAREEIK